MGLHPGQQVVQGRHRVQDVRPLVEHHALGSLGHGGVRDLRSRRGPFPGQPVQHLGRPYDRDVSGLTQPEDLLLHLRQALEVDLHRQVPPGDHDREGLPPCGLDDQLRKVADRFGGLDLGHECRQSGASLRVLLEKPDVGSMLHERVADDVGVGCDEFEVLAVLDRERVQVEVAVRKVESLGRPEDPPLGRVRVTRSSTAPSSVRSTVVAIRPSSNVTVAPTRSMGRT